VLGNVCDRRSLPATVTDEGKIREATWNLGISATLGGAASTIARLEMEGFHMIDDLIASIFGLTLGGLFVAAHIVSALVF
jgi:hypothetical protein